MLLSTSGTSNALLARRLSQRLLQRTIYTWDGVNWRPAPPHPLPRDGRFAGERYDDETDRFSGEKRTADRLEPDVEPDPEATPAREAKRSRPAEIIEALSADADAGVVQLARDFVSLHALEASAFCLLQQGLGCLLGRPEITLLATLAGANTRALTFLQGVVTEARACLDARVTVDELTRFARASKIDNRIALQCVRLCRTAALSDELLMLVLAEQGGRASDRKELVVTMVRLVNVARIPADAISRVGVTYGLRTLALVQLLDRLEPATALRLVEMRARWPRAYPHIVEMFTALGRCRKQVEGCEALARVGFEYESAKPVLECLFECDGPADVAEWVCQNIAALNLRATAVAFIAHCRGSARPTPISMSELAARWVVTNFDSPEVWEAHHGYITLSGQLTDSDRAHERLQALLHEGGDTGHADRALTAAEFTLADAQNLLRAGPTSARIHVANSEGEARAAGGEGGSARRSRRPHQRRKRARRNRSSRLTLGDTRRCRRDGRATPAGAQPVSVEESGTCHRVRSFT